MTKTASPETVLADFIEKWLPIISGTEEWAKQFVKEGREALKAAGR
jgi:hypothetical protein